MALKKKEAQQAVTSLYSCALCDNRTGFSSAVCSHRVTEDLLTKVDWLNGWLNVQCKQLGGLRCCCCILVT